MTRLLDLSRGAPLRIEMVDGGMRDCTFHHIDGSYSLCTVGDDQTALFHLHFNTPLVMVDERWEIDSAKDTEF